MCTHVSAQENRIPSKGYTLFSKDGSFQPYEFTRHAIGEHDIPIRTLYCGICHSDIHQVHNDWKEETISDSSRSRDCGRSGDSGQCRKEIQDRRHCRSRLHGKLLPPL